MKNIKKTNLNLFEKTEIYDCYKCKNFFEFKNLFIGVDRSDWRNPKTRYICRKCEAKF